MRVSSSGAPNRGRDRTPKEAVEALKAPNGAGTGVKDGVGSVMFGDEPNEKVGASDELPGGFMVRKELLLDQFEDFPNTGASGAFPNIEA